LSDSLEYLLMELGLSGLEAEAYLAVLAEPDSTGYRISQVLGKPAPNTYKALDSLVNKGAILPDEGSRRGLERIHRPQSEEGVYKLSTVHQVVARAEKMIENARDTLVADADNRPLKKLSENFLSAAERGVRVLLHGREPMSMPGCEFISSVTEGWQGDMLVLIADSSEYLIAFMSEDMRLLIQGVWSRNIIASCIYRGYMIKALFYRISMMIGEEGNSLMDIRAELRRLWDRWGYSDPGKEALAEVLREPDN
jgi:predicted transcriptional regulator